ncbi:DUF2063 domain-containing protein [Aestuariicella hydrocarbonica]|uniref:DUF2063 domain-containing protein n=1 Tax=Pseudomaricurvus hydrocarbonicus TaxID=1470433 RepID=A0A9E5JSQ1_9GAMM|nr:putative DNA-binding domain-containing protein [Aestuariicella hydrocarbonica]NHO64726.1 DUF2063 domain-containing protein [Aestuariicella hydrocarbonica]
MSDALPGFLHTQKQFADYVRDPDASQAPENLEKRRLKIYCDLVYNNIESFLSSGFPVLRSIYEDQDWHELVRDFIRSHESHSPYFLEISQEFLAYLQYEREGREGDPGFLLELAHYEWVELALDVSEEVVPVSGEKRLTQDLLQQQPLVSPLVWALSYQYPVHKIGRAFQPQQPSAEAVFILVYRNREDQVRFMETNALTVQLLNLLQGDEGLTGEQALQRLAIESGYPDPQHFVQLGHEILKKLQNSDVLF